MGKTLVACFSATGRTKKAAKAVAELLKADYFDIEPTVPYTKKDLNWLNPFSRSTKEMKDKSSRPEIASRVEHMEQYDRVLIGFPIWWYVAPTIINTFLEQYDFSGKTIGLFATSGGSGFGNTVDGLKKSVDPSVKWAESILLNRGVSEENLKPWMESK